jgi:hypothetical protein
MAAKKTSRKRKPNLLDTDPPILVGGGGSSFVWIRKDQIPKLVQPDDVPLRAPRPRTPGFYYIFEVRDSHVRVVVDDGTAPGPPKNVNGRYHLTTFE